MNKLNGELRIRSDEIYETIQSVSKDKNISFENATEIVKIATLVQQTDSIKNSNKLLNYISDILNGNIKRG